MCTLKVTWRIDYGFNIAVDFCIWVLELDGLHVPPFDQHPEGDRILQKRGLDAEAWREWLTTVVAFQDSILLWPLESQDQQSWVEEKLTSYGDWASSMAHKPDMIALRSSLEKQWIRLEQQYRAAVARVSHIPGDKSKFRYPADVWVGEPAVGELLLSLWQRYQSVVAERNPERRLLAQRSSFKEGSSTLLQDLEPYHARLDYLLVYQVNYPALVEYLIPPVAVILSEPHGLTAGSVLKARILNAAEDLATSRNSN